MAVEDIYAKACEAVERNNLDYAVKLFRQVLAARPDYPDARVALRMTERRRMEGKSGAATAPIDGAVTFLKTIVGKPRKKLEAYEDYLQKHPNSFWGLMNAAGAARKADLKGEAVNIYKDALRFKPDDKAALRRVSDTLREMDENAEALKFLGRLSALQPQNRDLGDEVRDLEAATHMAAHRVEQANSFRDLIRDKDEADRFEKEGRMAVTTDDVRREIAAQEKELEANPNQVNRILRVAQLYEDIGEPQKALELLGQKRQAMPDNYELREKMGDVAVHLADAQIAAVRRKLEVEVGNATIEKRLAELISRRDKYTLEELKWRLSQHPTDRDLQRRMGLVQFEMGEYNAAIASFQGLTQDGRFGLEATRMLGLCFLKKGQSDLALEQLSKAIEQHPDMDDEGKALHYSLAQAHEEGGNRAEALKAYKQIYSQDINYRDVAKKVDALNG